MLKTIRKRGITLALFAAGSTGLTAAINQSTKVKPLMNRPRYSKNAVRSRFCGNRYNNNLSEVVIWSMRRR